MEIEDVALMNVVESAASHQRDEPGVDVDGYDRVSPLTQQQAVAARRRPDVEHSAPT